MKISYFVLYDALGQEAFSKVLINEDQQILIGVDLENTLLPGIYTVIATSNNSVYKKKLIIE